MIYRNIVVAIPEEAYVSKDASVFIKDKNTYDPKVQYNRVHHTIIGRSFSAGLMYPNTNFRLRYPVEYEAASGEKVLRQTKRIGLYTVILSLAERTGLYSALHESFGIECANAIMDFAMYSIAHHSSAAENFPSAMADTQLFSNSIWSQKDYSALFKERMGYDNIEVFRRKWASMCRERGIQDTWLSIDGSNNNCQAVRVELAEKGKSKSGKNVNVIGYMYAVDSATGCPVTFAAYRGGRVDCKELLEIVGWLKAFGISAKGVIVDRGFATAEDFRLLDENGLSYVAMLKGEAAAHKSMFREHGEEIRMKYGAMLDKFIPGEARNAKLIPDGKSLLYGISSGKKIRIFSSHSYEAYASLIYDSANGRERKEAFYTRVTNEARKLQQKILDEEAGIIRKRKAKAADTGAKADGEAAEKISSYISIQVKDGHRHVFLDEGELEKAASEKGFYTLASSEDLSAAQANDIYVLRNGSEEQFSVLKSQLGYDVTRNHFTSGTIAKLTVGFVAAVLRNELMRSCQEVRIATNSAINELNMVGMSMNGRDEYYVSHTENSRQRELMLECGVIPSDLDYVAQQENKRMKSAEPDPFHRMPPRNDSQGVSLRRKPGRPPGSKNLLPKKKAVEPQLPKKRGRPKGSKNKKTLEREALEQATVKRGRGRPKGSKNKPKTPLNETTTPET